MNDYKIDDLEANDMLGFIPSDPDSEYNLFWYRVLHIDKEWGEHAFHLSGINLVRNLIIAAENLSGYFRRGTVFIAKTEQEKLVIDLKHV
jgi:hypothetical protein